jgi:uncharacterized lipoprotein
MKNLVLLALVVLALSACDQKGSNGKNGGTVQPENNTCGIEIQTAGTTAQILADSYRLKSCGISEEKAVSLLK